MTTPPTPDPARGLIETLLVAAGEPVELPAHLTRLAASLATLFGATAPAGLAADVRGAARDLRLGRLRITVDFAAGGPRTTLATAAVHPSDLFPTWEQGADLRSLTYAGGRGEHKWADRGALDDAGRAAVPLLLDRGGEVLEAGRANLFAAFGEVLATPAADGRILPGITRARVIAVARDNAIEVVERRLDRDDLFAADEVFLTGSVRGVEAAHSLDGVPLAATSDLGALIGDSLRRRWLGSLAPAI